ncbi:fimbria/pilus periplasmic chaperone [Aeromonas veronii]|uniref:fimbria/pilus periplasmic chaperone n=1 Tax=Aeromonas veronii TaxID=654 RepID=UPI0019598F1E|nr:fimbria/pilus periplasmic chaperone [Aeromonas veronii]HDO1314119.1 fimbria/pilus periplasmic chaperone [Aeromonas veronii]HDO1322955.1 fimbria/pilus periplasmic chaperone [Aeromonas veronii]
MRWIVSVFLSLTSLHLQAAVSLDRTRVIYPGGAKSISLTIHNNNNSLPYLAQAWLEDEKGNRVNSPFTILPPLQRLEPGMESLFKILALPQVRMLPQDRESIFYLNMREVPPRSNTPNTLQLALQTRIKFFYRPMSLLATSTNNNTPWQNAVEVSKHGRSARLDNPTPYYISFVEVTKDGNVVSKFEPVMLAPYGRITLPFGLGTRTSFTYIDDYGARRQLEYICASSCQLIKAE